MLLNNQKNLGMYQKFLDLKLEYIKYFNGKTHVFCDKDYYFKNEYGLSHLIKYSTYCGQGYLIETRVLSINYGVITLGTIGNEYGDIRTIRVEHCSLDLLVKIHNKITS